MVHRPVPVHDPPRLEALADRLEEIGLDDREAHLYARLAIDGPMRASEAARLSQLHRTEAYRVLESLISKGCVSARVEKPTLYEAIAVEKVFEDAAEAHHSRARALAQSRAAAVAALEGLRGDAKIRARAPAYRLLQGREAILEMASTMVNRMRESQSMVSTYFAAANATRENAPFLATIERAAQGIPMRFLVKETPKLWEAMSPLLSGPRVSLRWLTKPMSLRFTVVDQREILYWISSDPSSSLTARADVAIWTDAPDFVNAQLVLYDALWEGATVANGQLGHPVPVFK